MVFLHTLLKNRCAAAFVKISHKFLWIMSLDPLSTAGIMKVYAGDGTHHKKRTAYHRYKGEIPIAKNVMVTDENGNLYETTYPRRADGLVRKGRARWAGTDTICLASPPVIKQEADNMTNEIENGNITETTENTAATEIKPNAMNLKQAITLLERIRSTAVSHTMAGGLFVFIDTYNSVYDQAVCNGWIVDGCGISRVPKGIGTDYSTRGADMERIGCMAALLLDLLSCLPEAEKAKSAPPQWNGGLPGVSLPDIGSMISDAVDEAVSNAEGEIEDIVQQAVNEAMGLNH